jgi:hypothetical protein
LSTSRASAPSIRGDLGRRGARGLVVLAALAVSACQHIPPRPLSPERTAAALEARTLDDPALARFLEAALGHTLPTWPLATWDLHMLTLAALYYHPTLEVARSHAAMAGAAVTTAGARPNPTLSIAPEYSVNPMGAVSPWITAVHLDWVLETAGKRARRIERATAEAEAARSDHDRGLAGTPAARVGAGDARDGAATGRDARGEVASTSVSSRSSRIACARRRIGVRHGTLRFAAAGASEQAAAEAADREATSGSRPRSGRRHARSRACAARGTRRRRHAGVPTSRPIWRVVGRFRAVRRPPSGRRVRGRRGDARPRARAAVPRRASRPRLPIRSGPEQGRRPFHRSRS